MGITVVYEVECDKCGGEYANLGKNKKDFIVFIVGLGWKVTKTKTYCPKCKEMK